jgi:hypothetical protein
MYAQPNKKNVTYINQLPELHDLEDENEFSEKYQKHIRNHNKIFIQESGMNSPSEYNYPYHSQSNYPSYHPQSNYPSYHQNTHYQYNHQPYSKNENFHNTSVDHQPSNYSEHYTEKRNNKNNMTENNPDNNSNQNYNAHHHSCLRISEHVSKCPICIKFYKNDITIYIVIIAILTLVCLLLLKKILNM